MDFIKSPPGITFAASLGVTLIALICGIAANVGGIFVDIVSIGVICITGSCLLLKLMGKWDTLPAPMPLMYLIVTSGSALALLISAIVASAFSFGNAALGAAAFFQFAGCIGFCVLTYFSAREWRQWRSEPHTEKTVELKEPI